MSLRGRTFLIVAAAFLLAGGVLFFAIRSATLDGFRQIEEQEARREMERVLAALEYDVAAVRSHALDYAEWDDTWYFVRGENPKYFGTGLTDSTFKSQHVDAIAITDAADRIVLGKSYDEEKGILDSLPASLAAIGPGHPLLLHHRRAREEMTGFWLDPAGPMMVAALPIVRSDKSGELAGTLVFARYLDVAEIVRLNERLGTSMCLTPGWGAAAVRSGPALAPAPVDRVNLGTSNRDSMSVFAHLRLLNSADPLVVHMRLPRPTLAEAERVIHLGVGAFAILGCVTLAVILLLLHRLVLAPLERIGEGVREIARSGRTDRPLPVAGTGEFAELKRHFNEMLATIERSRGALAAAVEEANRANRAKSAFLASMSHEIRTPMNGVLGMIEMAMDRTEDLEVREMLLTARIAAQGQMALLNDILDLSKVEAGRLDLERSPFPLPDTVREASSAFRYRAKERGLALEFRCGQEVPGRVWGDALRVRQVVTNLVGNAMKFTETGSITVSVSAAAPAADGRVPVRVEVRDTGPGIPADRRARIFQEFGQADVTVARRFGGTGLGLAISSRLVEAMGGRLEVESAPGEGSAFHFTLPMEPAPAVAAEVPAAAAAPGPARTLRVLVADDNAVNLKVAKYFLERRGHSVETVDDGPGAVRRVAAGGIDVVLMDVHMPGMDGMEATRAIRAAEGVRRRTPIVALTASAMKEDVQTCLDAGMDSCLMKPVPAEVLVQAVESLAGPVAVG